MVNRCYTFTHGGGKIVKIIISPAKNMRCDFSYPVYETLPVFLDRAEDLACYLKTLPYGRLKEILASGDKIAGLNYNRYRNMDLRSRLTPAILAYDGIQYKYMAPAVFEDAQFNYIKDRLFILSGLYGVLRPLDGVVPYRLEMKAKVNCGSFSDLYGYWGRSIYDKVAENTDVIINLASKEYSKCVSKYVSPHIRFINITFGEESDGRITEKGVYVKMARGEMVRFMAEKNICAPEDIRYFDGLGYKFSEDLSTENNFIFLGRPKGTDRSE